MSKNTFKLWPDPPEGKKFGPMPKQRLLFIEDLPPEDTLLEDHLGNKINIKRPHYHPFDCVLYIGGAR